MKKDKLDSKAEWLTVLDWRFLLSLVLLAPVVWAASAIGDWLPIQVGSVNVTQSLVCGLGAAPIGLVFMKLKQRHLRRLSSSE